MYRVWIRDKLPTGFVSEVHRSSAGASSPTRAVPGSGWREVRHESAEEAASGQQLRQFVVKVRMDGLGYVFDQLQWKKLFIEVDN